ncbi:hypothetical protein SDC9_105832 [bioreactor metagenome]|uniref:Uncharacterized protein n=1 Tax=bioreactor metagenome TaxID=1076179 RepID=A0A645B0K1_9ZZZZ
MDGLIDDGSTAGKFHLTAPWFDGVVGFRPMPCHQAFYPRHSSDVFVREQSFEFQKRFVVTILETHADFLAAFLCQSERLQAFLIIQSQRFFLENVHAFFNTKFRDRIMQIVRQADMHNIQILFFQHRFNVCIKRHIRIFGLQRFIYVADRNQFTVVAGVDSIFVDRRYIS